MKSNKTNKLFLLTISYILIISLLSFCSFAFSTDYNENLVEGSQISQSFGELDGISFDYYDEEYSFRVLGINSNSATIRVEKTARDIQMDETLQFDIDDSADYDLFIKLLTIDGKNAIFEMRLNEKPEEDPEPEPEPDPVDDPAPQLNQGASNTSTSDILARLNDTDRKVVTSSRTVPKDKSFIQTFTGASTINVTINLTLTPQIAIGFLIASLIIVTGLAVFKSRSHISVASVVRSKRSKKRSKDSLLQKILSALGRFLAKIFKRLRLKLAELIAGEEFKKEDESDNIDYKEQKKHSKIQA